MALNSHALMNGNEEKILKRHPRELLFKILVIGDFGVGEYVLFPADRDSHCNCF